MEDEKNTQELEAEIQRLKAENDLLKEYRASLPIKERMYDKIPLTLKQMDIIVGSLLILLVIVIVLGIINA